jgi:hypothetical protein
MHQPNMQTETIHDSPDTDLRTGSIRPVRSDRAMCFGGFRVIPGARTLTLHHRAVPLGSRAFDLLVVLLRSRGRLVTKEEIVRDVWPSTFVDESNLRFQMAVLRKALGCERDRIKTIPGRGYLFAADDDGAPPLKVVLGGRRPLPRGHWPASLERVIIVVEPDADERDAIAALLRALKVKVLGFRTVDDLAAFAVSPPRRASA